MIKISHLYTDEGDIDTTSNHPFYVIGKGWVAAGDLVEGDEVYNLDGSTSTITGYEVEKLDEPLLVYNLEVEDFHSYFVGCVPVLVHNYKFARRCSAEEANAMDKASNLVPQKTNNGGVGKGAKWIYDLAGEYKPKKANGHEKMVIFTMEDDFMDWASQYFVNFDGIGKEGANKGKIIIKSNEPGAMGIGVSLLPEFKKHIKNITIK